MSQVPDNLLYTSEHEWVQKVSDTIIRVGITDYAQHSLGDIVYVDLPATNLVVGKSCGTIESVKAVSDIYSPASGKIEKINPGIADDPAVVNSDPYGEGWLFEASISNASELSSLLSPNDYSALVAGK